MRMVDIIAKKRDGEELEKAEIRYVINEYTNGLIPDYQMSAFAMAIYFQDMTMKERAELTLAMVETGDRVDLSEIEGIKVDKHSTGGVGDKTTIALAPLVAAVGVPVAKMSGRGLGHTGGTIDKLESIPHFSVEMEPSEFIALVNRNKLAVVGQTGNLAPADKKLYALRDVTASVNSIPLIASSIMSKKIASGADAIVLDVKTGSGAFMKDYDQARELAEAMVEIGEQLGRRTTAIISDMSQPLGYTVGNSLEVKEAIDLLKGEGPNDLYELCMRLGSQMVYAANKAKSLEEAREMLDEVIENGEALNTLKRFIESQKGDPSIVDDPSKLPTANKLVQVVSPYTGYVKTIDAEQIGIAAMQLGAGRATKESRIDLAVGIELHKKLGDHVKQGDYLATLHVNDRSFEQVVQMVENAYGFSDKKILPPNLIYEELI
ncbi:pyrimidine-nucleoside phosphorylase [Halalkalibacter hemicellulosilyticus]|uniref:Pyrimidine-nucleoside phosphorylase n=1 Tax=Halalkalibacter hemicellulosilyticusJCM 9152 TaxID=1236971 RepID=W4QH57_9BACI|nr:pyrimidine-nucleoside phosphorylase [Halalkalibacter hemicellulosilyticus]GAE30973.1 pyrimidine-nucleoside phosphorylase [Halalkalibacter hemicellulosilyticusJCM 9152]